MTIKTELKTIKEMKNHILKLWANGKATEEIIKEYGSFARVTIENYNG